jgi:integrase
VGKQRRKSSNPKRRMGKHPREALSPIAIRHLNEPGYYCDGNGLYLQVAPGGSKSWIVRTTINGKRCELGAGGFAYTSLADARQKAIEIRKAARNGGDPLAEKHAEREEARRKAAENERPTFEAAAREVHGEHSKTFRNPKHAAQWITTLETYAFPAIGATRVDKVESADVLKVLSPIWLEIRETADRVKQRMRTVFDWSMAKGYRSTNPVAGITKVLPKHNEPDKHHAALPYKDVPAFIQTLRSDAGISGRLAFEFCILTASRTGEVIQAKWTEIDFATKTWTRPPAHMKAKKEHKIPLAPRCIDILKEAKQLSGGSDYIFPGMYAGRSLSNMVFHMTLRRMNKTGFTPHGFRSSFRDWAEEKGRGRYSHRAIEESLAHGVPNKVEGAYLRTQLFEQRRELMADWARFATAAPSAKVVKMRGEKTRPRGTRAVQFSSTIIVRPRSPGNRRPSLQQGIALPWTLPIRVWTIPPDRRSCHVHRIPQKIEAPQAAPKLRLPFTKTSLAHHRAPIGR